MKQRITAVVGLSGVGKTFALKVLSERGSFQHLSAGQLISEARQLPASAQMLESLRGADIEENQKLLVVGFEHAKDLAVPHVVLDGHTAIETPSGLVILGSEIFKALGIDDMIFLASSPTTIFERRAGDSIRRRPPATLEMVRDFQETALLAAFRISLQLQIPLAVVDPTHIERLAAVLF